MEFLSSHHGYPLGSQHPFVAVPAIGEWFSTFVTPQSTCFELQPAFRRVRNLSASYFDALCHILTIFHSARNEQR